MHPADRQRLDHHFAPSAAHRLAESNGRNALTAAMQQFKTWMTCAATCDRKHACIKCSNAPNVVPDKTRCRFLCALSDEIHRPQVSKMVDSAARAAALPTGIKVKFDHDGEMRAGINVDSLSDVAFVNTKMNGATDPMPEPGRPQGRK
ncbi:MAG: hypothetical protein ABI767_08005 [Rhodanobacter sp.]